MRNIKQAYSSMLLGLIFLLTASESMAAMVDFRELVKSAGPAVVNINTEQVVPQRRQLPPGFERFPKGPGMEWFFDDFFGGAPGGPRDRTRRQSSLGSGFVISADGYIVTNNHVIDGADIIKVSFTGKAQKKKEGEDSYEAKVIGTDPDTDLALLKIKAENLPFLKFGDSDALEVGEWLLAIGNPLGLDRTVTAGILSAKSRNIHSGSYDDFLQTDASINPGNSGGPLLNMNSDVVGINTAIARQAQGIGFAIPSNMAKKIIDDLKNDRKVSRGWLGVTIQSIDAATAKALELPNTSGALINSVMDGQPADKAGIRSGDVIVAVNGQAVEDTDQLLRRVALLAPGKEATVTIWRDGKKQDLTLVVAERSAGGANGPQDAIETALGLKVRPLEQTEANKLKLGGKGGIFVVNVDAQSIAAVAGIRPNDVIVSVNRKPIVDVTQFNAIVANAEKNNGVLLLHLSREGQLFFRAIEFTGKK